MRWLVTFIRLNLSLAFETVQIIVSKCLPAAETPDEAFTNVLCEDDEEYGVGKTLTRVSYALIVHGAKEKKLKVVMSIAAII